jgi:hypothetical protein
MNHLQKIIEQGGYGEKPCRVAYAFEVGLLPVATVGMMW